VLGKKIRQKRQISLESSSLHHAQKMESTGILAGGVAHDFNNILSAIIGYGYMAQKMLKSDAATYSYIQEILDSANRARRPNPRTPCI